MPSRRSPFREHELDRALVEVIPLDFISAVQSSRYGDRLREICSRELWSPSKFAISQSGGHLGEFGHRELIKDSQSDSVSAELLLRQLRKEGNQGVEALYTCMMYAYSARIDARNRGSRVQRTLAEYSPEFLKTMASIGDFVADRLRSEILQEQIGAIWSLAWLGHSQFWTVDKNIETLDRLFEFWATTTDEDVLYLSAWAICENTLRSPSDWSKLRIGS